MKTIKYFRTVVLLGGFVPCLVSMQLMAEGTHHWTYEGAEGPEHWGELTTEFRMCSEGANQSPIDLVADVSADLPELQFEYYLSPVDEINNGHTIQQNIEPGSFFRIPDLGMNFELKQLHFHSPSEHTIDGKSFAMEIHFVHADENGALAVVGVMIDEGEEHSELSKLWSFMPEQVGGTSKQPVGIEETNLLPPTREYFTYGGSLTTPPCSEGVRWTILKTPVEASAAQVETFQKRMGSANNRPLQSQNARLILD